MNRVPVSASCTTVVMPGSCSPWASSMILVSSYLYLSGLSLSNLRTRQTVAGGLFRFSGSSKAASAFGAFGKVAAQISPFWSSVRLSMG
jgi:hypothetical protein